MSANPSVLSVSSLMLLSAIVGYPSIAPSFLTSDSKKFELISSDQVGLKKVQAAYDQMAREIRYPGNTALEKTDAMKFYSKEIVTGMEEFIISKASKESLEGEGSKELPFNDRYPNLRAPSFQTCIDNVYSYQEEVDKLQPHPHFHLGKIKAIVDEFKKRARELDPPQFVYDDPNLNPLQIILDLYDDPFENSDSEAPAAIASTQNSRSSNLGSSALSFFFG